MRVSSSSTLSPSPITHLSQAQLELDHLTFGFGQSFQVQEISAFEFGALAHAIFRVSTAALPVLSQNPFLSQLLSKSFSVLAVGVESLGIEVFKRLSSTDQHSDNFKNSWFHNFVQIGVLRGLNSYFPTQSILLRHLSADLACLLSEDLLASSSHRDQAFSKRLFDLEVQNWQWGISTQLFHLASAGSFHALQQVCESRSALSLKNYVNETRLPEVPMFLSAREAVSMSHEATFTHPDAVDAYLEREGIHPDHAMVTFTDREGNEVMSAWGRNRENYRRLFAAASCGSFFVCRLEMHPVPEFAHLSSLRLIEDILPILEHCEALTQRFPHGILRHSLEYLAEHSPIDLYFLRRKVASFEHPLSEHFQYDLSDWLREKLAEVPEGAKTCPWILAKINDFSHIEASDVREIEMDTGRPAFAPAYRWKFDEHRYILADVEKRHFELVDKGEREIGNVEGHLRELNAWVDFLLRSNLWASRFLSIKNHLNLVMRLERFAEGDSFRIASSILLKVYRYQYKNFEFCALVPIVRHSRFANKDYDAVFRAIREDSKTDAIYLEKLLKHALYLYDLTRDFSLKEAFERAIENSGASRELRNERIQELNNHVRHMPSS